MKYSYDFEQEDKKRIAKLKRTAELLKTGEILVKSNIFCHIIIGMMIERLRKFKEKEWAELIELYPPEGLFQPAVKVGRDFEKIIRCQRLLRKIDRKNKQSNDHVVKRIDFGMEIERLNFGLIKQICDVASGFFEAMHKAGSPLCDTRAQEFLVKALLGNPTSYYSKLSSKRKFVNELHWLMMEVIKDAIKNWENNLYMSFEELLKGVIRRRFKGSRQAEHRRKLYEFLVRDDWLIDALSLNDTTLRNDKSLFNMVKELKQNPIYANGDGIIFIEQIADEVGVTAQTLRNWDKSGKYPAHEKIVDEKKYRVYYPEDIIKLKQVKYEQQRRRISAPEGFYKLGEVAKVLKVHPDTITRKEAGGQLPKPKRDSFNGRIYSMNDIKKIKKIVG